LTANRRPDRRARIGWFLNTPPSLPTNIVLLLAPLELRMKDYRVVINMPVAASGQAPIRATVIGTESGHTADPDAVGSAGSTAITLS
jgi:hypothetical protein